MARDQLVVVRGEDVHGMPAESYGQELAKRLPDTAVRVARTAAEWDRAIPDATVVTGSRITEADLEHAESLALFACSYAGTDHLPLSRLRDRGVTVTNASGVHAPNVAEHVVGTLLYFTRKFHIARRRQAREEWRHYRAGELAGSEVTVVGLGAIGTAVCERLAAFDVDLVGVRHTPERGGPVDTVTGYDDLETAVATTDALVLCCPLTDETRGIVDGPLLRTLPSEAVLVNVARGPVVDTDALLSALQRGQLRGAALDVTDPEPLPPEHPLWRIESVLLTPHNAGHTPAYYERLAEIVAANVTSLRTDESLENVVVDPR